MHRHARRARREVLQQRVGRERVRVGQQDRAARAREVLHPDDGDRCPRAPTPSRGTSARGRRRATRPTPRRPCRSSCSAPQPSTPPAPQPTSAPGRSASCTPSSVASGSSMCPPEANSTTRSAGAPSSAGAGRLRGLDRADARVLVRRDAGADADAHALSPYSGATSAPTGAREAPRHTAPRGAAGDRDLRSDGNRQDRRRGRAGGAAARRGGGSGRDLGRRAAGLRGARAADRRRERGRAGGAGAPARVVPAGRRDASAPASTRRSRTRRSTARWRPGGGRSSSAARASTCAPR